MRALKVCQLCSVDFTLQKFLLPLVDAMRDAAWDVTAVCPDGPDVDGLRRAGYRVETLPITRGMHPLLHLKSLWRLVRLFRRERFDVLPVHTSGRAAGASRSQDRGRALGGLYRAWV